MSTRLHVPSWRVQRHLYNSVVYVVTRIHLPVVHGPLSIYFDFIRSFLYEWDQRGFT